MKRILALLLCLLFLIPAAQAERVSSIPALLKFTQATTEREYLRTQFYVQRTYPATANQAVNQEMKTLIDEMTNRGKEFMPLGSIKLMPSYLDVGATIYRTGEKWMSFLTIARIAYEREQIYVDFDARAYDMETGKRLTLSDLFAPDSAAWDLMAQEVRRQLMDYYVGSAPDEAMLAALCSRESLENTPFTLSAAKLTLHFRADSLYDRTHTLMHVKLYYPQIRPLMTEEAQRNTDNSRYKMIALTYDDGGARGSSMNVVDQLRRFGANATFFIVGTTIRNNHDVLCREHDAGYAVESHNYEHVYDNLTKENVLKWKERFDREMNAVIGTRATYMRAPGGKYKRYIDGGVGLPLIQWSVISGDVGSDKVNSIAGTVINNAQDGAVVLMHDLNSHACKYTEIILPALEERGYLCVTVDELFAHYGVALEPNTLYYSCEEVAAARP